MHLAESSSRSYVSAINNCEQLARQIGLDSTALYGVSLDVATRTKDLLTATKEYTATNARQNNRLRAALAKNTYSIFLCRKAVLRKKGATRF